MRNRDGSAIYMQTSDYFFSLSFPLPIQFDIVLGDFKRKGTRLRMLKYNLEKACAVFCMLEVC